MGTATQLSGSAFMSCEKCGATPCQAQIQSLLCCWLELGRIYKGENMQFTEVH